ncbi:MAG: urea ABC transporter substrate-binding protein [Kangiellaceae bacterium]|nr:urea ABC transporter substrate-binding protein [Kangiellaceae bacterium]MCW9000988.1 urea ABC transporter substrate-binding protein [Kangiellaceae bacterium]MCW9016507.1 urea ABC transporter substrate-binding protein [Kangiellaceae bacterium]
MDKHRTFYLSTFLLISLATIVGIAVRFSDRLPIKVGVMHSLTGTMAISEKGVVDAVLFAIDEINQSGGLLGRKIETIVKDGESSPEKFATIAAALINQDQVDVVFGCWTSNCRKAVRPIFESHNHLLYYPLQYEGMESSKNIIYLGEVPNQQVIPALELAFSTIGKKIFLVGSDYIYPRATNEIIKDQVKQWRGEVVGESYVELGETDFSSVIEKIKSTKPQVIFNTINGDSNLSFFKALRDNQIMPEETPTFSFSISEDELTQFNGTQMAGDFLVWNYLQDLDNRFNQNFVSRFKAKYGEDRVIGNPMVSAYLGVHLWAKAVNSAKSSDVERVLSTATDLSIQGPSGMVYVETANRHTWKPIHIAKIEPGNRLKSVWFSKIPIAPKPFPESRSREEWLEFIEGL